MIRKLVDFSLNNRFIVLSLALLLFVWGVISFKALPVEAYPDVANTWVQVITQWPGRAAEEVEQQVTVPIEIQMNGIPDLQHVRSASLSGLSVVNLIFDDNSDNDKDRQKVIERLAQVRIVDMDAKHFHLLVRRPREGVGEEAHRVGERLLRRFEPDEAPGQDARFVVERKRLQVPSPRGAVTTGRRSRSTAATARARRSLNVCGRRGKSPSSK